MTTRAERCSLFLFVVGCESVKADNACRERDAVVEAHDRRQHADCELLHKERRFLGVQLEELALDVCLCEPVQVLVP